MTPTSGTLFLCATPIGNLEDITLRVLRTLNEVTLIACEDTRHSLRLLRHYDIEKPLMSFHEYSRDNATERILDTLRHGDDVALLSDAGMPGISDPGYVLVQAAQDAGLPYTVLPGASAGLTALVLSGFPAERFLFEGFLPRQGKAREKRLKHLDRQSATALIYESPHRIQSTLEEFSRRWPERRLAAVREISKKFEEVVQGSTADVARHFREHEPRGEFVLVLHAAAPPQADELRAQALNQARTLIAQGMGLNAAAKEAAQVCGLSKRDLYQSLLNDTNADQT